LTSQFRYGLVLALVAASRYVVLADLTIADLIGADLQTSFQTTPAQLLLARNAMPISLTMAIPLAVMLVSWLGLVRSFLFSLGAFATALLLSGTANSLSVFVLGRIMQGFATAVMSSQTFALVQVFVPRSMLTRGVALIAGVGAVGLATGPLLASVAVGPDQWRLVFGALAVVVLLLVPVAALVLSKPLEKSVSPIVGVRGFLTGSATCAALGLLLTRWPAGSVLDSPWMRGVELLLVILMGGALLTRLQCLAGTWAQPVFQMAFVVRLLLFGVMATPSFFLLLYLRNQLGWTSGQAALLGVSLSGPMLLGILLSSWLMRCLSLVGLLHTGLLAMALAMVGWSQVVPLAPLDFMVLSNALLGLAIGLLVPAVTASGLRAAAPGQGLAASAAVFRLFQTALL